MINTTLFNDNEMIKQLFENEEAASKLDELITVMQEELSKDEFLQKVKKIESIICNDVLAEDIVDIVNVICSKKSVNSILELFGIENLRLIGSLVTKELIMSKLENVEAVIDVIAAIVLEHAGWNKTEIETEF